MGACDYTEQLRPGRGARVLDAQRRSRHLRAVRSWPRARLAVWAVAVGIVLSSATVISSALNVLSIQQTIAMALASTLTTLGGLIAWIVPDAWIAWRRGFRRGCETASYSYRMPRATVARRRRGRDLRDCCVGRCGPG